MPRVDATLEEFEENPPEAESLVESLRAFGYRFNEAVADILDNSVTAKATTIHIEGLVRGGQPILIIQDNGEGMSRKRLVEAMRLGSRSPLDDREPHDLGRYSLGLKTATFSQAEGLAVITKRATETAHGAYWELPRIRETRKWMMGRGVPSLAKNEADVLEAQPHGTTVIWYLIDRIFPEAKQSELKDWSPLLEDLKRYLAMIFHRYLRSRISITVGTEKLKPWDPFLTSHTKTYTPIEEDLTIHGKTIHVKGYVLPHKSHLTNQEFEDAAGINGWNAQQGFYIYRNDRLIVPGTWFGFSKADEHCKLARISIDIPTALDKAWHVDVRKATVQPPRALINDLRRIAQKMRTSAQEVYRGRVTNRRSSEKNPEDIVWLRRAHSDGHVSYKVNRKHAGIVALRKQVKDEEAVDKIIDLVESSLPFRAIEVDVHQHGADRLTLTHTKLELQRHVELAQALIVQRMKALKLTRGQAIQSVCQMEPFCNIVEIQPILQESMNHE